MLALPIKTQLALFLLEGEWSSLALALACSEGLCSYKTIFINKEYTQHATTCSKSRLDGLERSVKKNPC